MSAGEREMLERLMRYMQPEKVLPYLRDADETRLAAVLGARPGAYRQVREEFASQVRETAVELLKDEAIAEQVERLPFKPGDTIVGIGESDTADLLSWLEILRQLLDLRRKADGITVLNTAVSGQTTTEALSRWAAAGGRAAWVLCKLGANDARRAGHEGPTLVSPAETRRNLTAMRELSAPGAQWIWMTPHPVDEERIEAFAPFRHQRVSWRGDDIAAIAASIREREEPVADVHAAFSADARHDLLGQDGVHPTPAGQRVTLLTLLAALTAAPGPS
ncbi:SGNH/GDSL hydrolase family protein [Streptosporangium sp. NPDC000396]|uniref:SGNH/GDSL hydrolase family protein n=1 Tax=Streptosporangium sp. NPDC000396 TaxID=3366185 RepID=UPI0036CECCA8